MVTCEINECNFVCEYPSRMKRHLADKHKIGVDWIYCDECDKKFKNNTGLKQHKLSMHTNEDQIDWIYCEIENCNFRCKFNSELTKHLKNIHEIGEITWYECPFDECKFKSKRKKGLKEHIRAKHINKEDINWLQCDQCDRLYKNMSSLNKHIKINHGTEKSLFCQYENCDYTTNDPICLKKHINNKHNPNPKLYFCDVDGCEYSSKSKYGITTHKRDKHNIGNIQRIQCRHCNFKSKTKSNLKSHLRDAHNIGVKWVYCKIGDCNSKFKTKRNLKEHQANIHDIGVIWKYCQIENCDYKAKTSRALKIHYMRMHNPNAKTISCNLCEYMCKTNKELKSHQMRKHNINVEWHYCDLCNHKSKTIGDLEIHKMTHGIGINWLECDLCDKKFKRGGDLNQHKKNVHLIGVNYYYCDIDNCTHQTKYKENLKTHKEMVHDIGDHQCEFCLHNRNSKMMFKDQLGKHFICKKCYQKVTGKNSKAEEDMSNYLDKIEELKAYLISSDQSFISIGGCQRYRPDKLYASDDLVLHIECDEHQHKYQQGFYTCDEKRISDCYDEFPGKKYLVIRWNPDYYKHQGTADNRKQRLEKLKKFILDILVQPLEQQIFIYYMYYDIDNPLLSKNIPYQLIT